MECKSQAKGGNWCNIGEAWDKVKLKNKCRISLQKNQLLYCPYIISTGSGVGVGYAVGGVSWRADYGGTYVVAIGSAEGGTLCSGRAVENNAL